jgi:hypothetical protein
MIQESIKFGEKDYALVPARLLKFREANPRGSVTSKSNRFEDGSIEFVTHIIKDKSDEYSAEADGHATYGAIELKKPKSYEKLETISVGRALAKLGYLNDGQIATTEEMEEFEAYQLTKVEEAVEAVKKATKRGDFETIIAGLSAEQQKQVAPIIKKRMLELKNG